MTQAQMERSTPTAPMPVTNLVPGSMNRRLTWRRILLLIGPVVLIVAGGVYYLFSGRYVSTDDAYIKSRMLSVTATVPGQVVAVPVSVGGQLWGVIGVGSRQEPLLANTEGRLADFADLASTAIVNAETQGALAESRARIVAAADQTRRRVERDLHDGAQQRLVSLTLHLREARAAAPAGAPELAARLDDAVTEVTGVLEELREIARGLHPAALSEGGLGSALGALARRSAVPVDLDVQVTGRLPETAEVAAYYAVAEAVTNTAKHARASAVKVEVAARDRVVHLRVSDDGRGGADFGRGSGLVGLKDRVEALGGRILLDSPPGSGTVLDVVLPLDAQAQSAR